MVLHSELVHCTALIRCRKLRQVMDQLQFLINPRRSFKKPQTLRRFDELMRFVAALSSLQASGDFWRCCSVWDFFGGGLNQSIIWCWMLRWRHKLGCLNHLNLPTSGGRGRVYLSLLQWSAWPSSAPNILTNPVIHKHSGEWEKLSLPPAWTNISSRLVAVTVSLCCLSAQGNSWVETRGGGAPLRCCSSAGPSQLLHCSPFPPSGTRVRSRIPGPSAYLYRAPTILNCYFLFHA